VARSDPYAVFRFVVEFGGLLQAGFSKVRGLQRETKVESIREGGVNDFERKLVTLTTYPPLTLERGLASAALWEWHQQVIEGRVLRLPIRITVRDERGRDGWSWTALSAFPSKWGVSDLDAGSGQVAAETIEFVHHGLLRSRIAGLPI
jgi:phage tail-like protein